MTKGNSVVLALALVLGLLLHAQVSSAHEFIVVPQSWKAYTAGQKLPVSVVSSHVFMKSEELEIAEKVAVSYNSKDVPVVANEAYATYDGVVTLEGPGAAMIRGHRKGDIWSKTTQGMKRGGRDTLEGVVEARLYEKFCKTLLPVDGSSEGWDAIVGDALEIVPLDNPLEAKAGDVIRVRILFNGKPVLPEMVTATYDGFTDLPNSYAFFTEPYGEGEAAITLTEPGFWMIRVQYAAPVEGKDYEKHIIRSVLAFPVAE